MVNTPTECADDLPTIPGFFTNHPKSRSVNNSLQRSDLDPNSIKQKNASQSSAQETFTSPKTHQKHSRFKQIVVTLGDPAELPQRPFKLGASLSERFWY